MEANRADMKEGENNCLEGTVCGVSGSTCWLDAHKDETTSQRGICDIHMVVPSIMGWKSSGQVDLDPREELDLGAYFSTGVSVCLNATAPSSRALGW